MKRLAILILLLLTTTCSAEFIPIPPEDIDCGAGDFREAFNTTNPVILASQDITCSIVLPFNYTTDSFSDTRIDFILYFKQSPWDENSNAEKSLDFGFFVTEFSRTFGEEGPGNFTFEMTPRITPPEGMWYLNLDAIDTKSGELIGTAYSLIEVIKPSVYQNLLLTKTASEAAEEQSKAAEKQAEAAEIQANSSKQQVAAAEKQVDAAQGQEGATQVLVLVTAIFGFLALLPEIRILYNKKFRNPEVRIVFMDKEPFVKDDITTYQNMVGSGDVPIGPTCWVRVKIGNELGREKAKGVYVKLLDIYDSKKRKSIKDFDPIRLNWVGPRRELVDLCGGEEELVDVFWTSDSGILKDRFILAGGLNENLVRAINAAPEKRNYIFKLCVYGDNFEPRYFSLKIKVGDKYNNNKIELLDN